MKVYIHWRKGYADVEGARLKWLTRSTKIKEIYPRVKIVRFNNYTIGVV